MPPSSTGRASSPAACSTLAAIAARAPLSQIVTIGRSPQVVLGRRGVRCGRGGACCRDEAGVALLGLADVEQTDLLGGQAAFQLLDRHGLELSAPPAGRQPGEVEDPDRREALRRRAYASASSLASSTSGRSGSTNAASWRSRPRDRHVDERPARWPAANACGVAHIEEDGGGGSVEAGSIS